MWFATWPVGEKIFLPVLNFLINSNHNSIFFTVAQNMPVIVVRHELQLKYVAQKKNPFILLWRKTHSPYKSIIYCQTDHVSLFGFLTRPTNDKDQLVTTSIAGATPWKPTCAIFKPIICERLPRTQKSVVISLHRPKHILSKRSK